MPAICATLASRGLRFRLHALSFGVAAGFLALALIRANERLHAEERQLREQAEVYAQTAARAFDASVREAAVFLQSVDLTLGELPPSSYERVLRALGRSTRSYFTNVLALGTDGRVLATMHDTTGVPPLVPTDCLARAESDRAFTVCLPRKAPTADGRVWTMVFVQPCYARGTGVHDGFVVAYLPVDSLEAMRLVRGLPPQSVLTVFDPKGIVMLRTLDPDRWMGRVYPNFERDAKVPVVNPPDTVILSALDQRRRLFGTLRLASQPWNLYVGIPVEVAFGPSRRQFVQDLVIGLAISIAVLLLGYWVVGRLVRPIEALTADARAISEGDMSRRSSVTSDDEVGELARTFNRMADAIVERTAALASSQEQLRQSQKLEALGAFAGGIAHEFNNYLTSIIGHAELALHPTVDAANATAEIRGVLSSARRAAQLTRQVLVFSRRQVVEPRQMAVGDAIREAARLLERLLGETITLRVEVASGLGTVLIDPAHLEQVLMNLGVNARDAMPSGGALLITVDRAPERERLRLGLEAASYVRISVSDSGQGVPEAARPHLFEPFFTTKPRQHGTGLGLSISYGIIQSAGGVIELDTTYVEGAMFRFYLPEHASAPSSFATPPGGTAVAGGTERVLLVEDEASVAEVARRLLTRAGYQVTVMRDAASALVVLQREAFDVMLSDVVMPGTSGATLAREAHRLYPGLPVVLMSGYPDDDAVALEISQQRVAFLPKPFTQAALLAMVRAALDADARAVPS